MRLDLRILAASAALLTAACSDTSTAPAAKELVSVSDRAPAFDFSAGGRYGVQGTQFTVSPNGGSFSIGGLYTLNCPSNAICDPSQSTYGDGEWNNACVTLTSDLTITATLQLTSNGLAVDFTPDIRFSPDAQVTISTDIFAPVIRANREYLRRNPSTLRPLALYYEPTLNASPVADYLSDPDAITHIDLSSGRIWRRVKHFSGYNVTSGASCDPAPDQPDCIQVDQ
jgi:hypothetical protein